MVEKRKLKGIADLYAVEDARKEAEKSHDLSAVSVAGHATPASPAIPASHATPASHAKMVLQALPVAGHAIAASPATETALEAPAPDLFASLPKVGGYLKLGNQIIDHLLPQLEPFEQILYLQLYRLSHGNGKHFCLISMPKLARRTKISQRSLWRALADLDRKGLARKTSSVHGKGKEQGITFWVAAPAGHATQAGHDSPARHATQADNKIKTIKRNNINTESHRLSPEEVKENSHLISELLEGGYTREQAEAQFAGSFHPDDWKQILATLNTQGASKEN